MCVCVCVCVRVRACVRACVRRTTRTTNNPSCTDTTNTNTYLDIQFIQLTHRDAPVFIVLSQCWHLEFNKPEKKKKKKISASIKILT
jgi:hypothetical protein